MNTNLRNKKLRIRAARETREHQKKVRRGLLLILGRNRGERRRRAIGWRNEALHRRRVGDAPVAVAAAESST